jgi:hypothetical protein
MGERHLGRPLGVVGLHRDEDRLERRGDALQLVDVQRPDRDRVLAAGTGELEAAPLHGLDVLGPLIHERDVVPRLGEQPADHAADGARAEDPDPHVRRLLRLG